jgi:hypothetical protein
MNVLFVIVGAVGMAVGIFGKNSKFTQADATTASQGTRKASNWTGRLVFFVVGMAFFASGIASLMGIVSLDWGDR